MNRDHAFPRNATRRIASACADALPGCGVPGRGALTHRLEGDAP